MYEIYGWFVFFHRGVGGNYIYHRTILFEAWVGVLIFFAWGTYGRFSIALGNKNTCYPPIHIVDLSSNMLIQFRLYVNFGNNLVYHHYNCGNKANHIVNQAT